MDDQELERLADRLAEKLAARQSVEQRLMDLPDTARYMGRSLSAVQHLVKKGIIPVTWIDSKPQTDRVVLNKLIIDSTRWPV